MSVSATNRARTQAPRRGLTADQVETYRRDGQLEPGYRIPDALLAEVRQAADRLVAARPEIPPEFIPNPHVAWDDSAEAKAIAETFFRVARDPGILDAVEAAIGPDIVFWAAALFCKPPRQGREIAWHQDGIYWPIKPPATVTVWLALDDTTVENGAMEYVPGSHALGVLPHEVRDQDGLVLNNVLSQRALDLGEPRPVLIEAGQIALHDIHLVHGSPPNRSDRRRAGLTLRYMPATSHFDRYAPMGVASNTAPVEFANRPIWLLRGVDRCGHNDFAAGHSARTP